MAANTWLGINLTTVIPYLGVSQLLISVSCNVFKIVWLELLPHITSIRKTLCWLSIEHCSIFKTALLVYKFLHSGYPKIYNDLPDYLHLATDFHIYNFKNRTQTNSLKVKLSLENCFFFSLSVVFISKSMLKFVRTHRKKHISFVFPNNITQFMI